MTLRRGAGGSDRGRQGALYYGDNLDVLSVKSGKIMPAHVRELRGVLDREGAEIGVLLTMNPPTREMQKEAATAGFYASAWGQHPRLQILTVEELLGGRGIDYPAPLSSNVTIKKAPAVRPRGETLPLPGIGAPIPARGAPAAREEAPPLPGLATARPRGPRGVVKTRGEQEVAPERTRRGRR